jgi:hypothetical protein
MSDYGAEWPLWGECGGLDPADPELSDDLRARLYAWQEHFEKRYHLDHGWRSRADAEAYAADGRTLQRLLTAEIGRWAIVELDLWPVPAEEDLSAPRPVKGQRRGRTR